MIVKVDSVTTGFGSIAQGSGTDEETGDRITFAGDARPMCALGEAVEAAETEDDLPEVEVEGWQITGRVPKDA